MSSWIHPIESSNLKDCVEIYPVNRELEQLEASYGGKCLPAIRNKYRWKAPWPMVQGNTVSCIVNRDGSRVILATGRAAEVTRKLLGPEDSTKLMGSHGSGTHYAVWVLNGPTYEIEHANLTKRPLIP